MPNAQDELKRLNNMILMTFTPEEGLVTNYTGYTDPNVAWSPPENTVKPGFEIEPIKVSEPLPHDPMDAHWQALIAERDKLKERLTEAENRQGLAEIRVSELEGALQTIIDGIPVVRAKPYRNDGVISKMDYCPHNLHVYEDCGECISDFARAVLSRTSEEA
jgi:hypothetical protein